MYYENTINIFKRRLKEEYSSATPRRERDDSCFHEYLLWMVNEIEMFDTSSVEAATKAGRWIGWVLFGIEEKLGWWPNQYSRDIMRVDVRNGLDKPH